MPVFEKKIPCVEFFCFPKMQFGLCRAAPFVSFPIGLHLFYGARKIRNSHSRASASVAGSSRPYTTSCGKVQKMSADRRRRKCFEKKKTYRPMYM